VPTAELRLAEASESGSQLHRRAAREMRWSFARFD
jgi:hypothetical protein